MEILKEEWAINTGSLDLVGVGNGYSVRCSVGTGSLVAIDDGGKIADVSQTYTSSEVAFLSSSYDFIGGMAELPLRLLVACPLIVPFDIVWNVCLCESVSFSERSGYIYIITHTRFAGTGGP